MQIDAELSTLRTRLQGSWSAGSALSSMSKKLFVEEVIRHYDTFEKKVKMRILISLLGLDKAKKSELAQPIVKLLELASRDTSDEVFPSLKFTKLYVSVVSSIYISG